VPRKFSIVAEGSDILRRQKVVAVERLLDRLIGLPGMAHMDVVQTPFHLYDVLGVALDVTRLTLESARRLMQQDAGVGQRLAHALLTRRKQKRAHGRGLTDAKGGHGRPDELHRVVDRHAGGDDAPRNLRSRSLGLREVPESRQAKLESKTRKVMCALEIAMIANGMKAALQANVLR
jgi:hypothetical protein